MFDWPYGRQYPRNDRPYPRPYGRGRPRRPRERLPRGRRYWEQQQWLVQQQAARRSRLLMLAALGLGLLVTVGVIVGTVVGLASSDDGDTTTTTVTAATTTVATSGCGPHTITNGNVQITGDTATYSCNTCYGLLGPQTRTCQNGVWSGTVPRCIGCGCPETNPSLTRRRKKRQSKIIGGIPAVENSWPWQVGFKPGAGQSTSCGGSLVSEQWIVTAAHCFYEDNNRVNDLNTVSLGDHNPTSTGAKEQEVSFQPSSVFIHSNYTPTGEDFDIALVKIPTVTLRRDAIWPVCLPMGRTFNLGEEAWATGWGALDGTNTAMVPEVLQQVQVDVIPRTQCSSAAYTYSISDITNNMICAGVAAGGKDTCPGDSGGPLVVQRDNMWYLAGVTSWGRVCGTADSPGVYARVSQLEAWVQKIIADN